MVNVTKQPASAVFERKERLYGFCLGIPEKNGADVLSVAIPIGVKSPIMPGAIQTDAG